MTTTRRETPLVGELSEDEQNETPVMWPWPGITPGSSFIAPCSAATCDTALFDPAITAARCSRSLVVSRDRGGITTVRSRNERRGHAAGRHTRRRLRHHSSTR